MGDVFAFIQAALPWIAMGLLLAVLAVRNSHGKKQKDKSGDYGTEGMCLGTALGSSFGNNTGLGISLGMLIGLAVGTSIRKDQDNENDEEI